MNYKRILMFLMVCFISITMLSGCSDSSKDVSKNAKIYIDGLKIEVLSCSFDNEVMGIDEEMSSWGFTEKDGKVYVNLALKITNNSSAPFNKDDITGYFEYDEFRYDLQYELMSSVPLGSNDGSISPECIGFVNMISLIDEAATSENLTVHFAIRRNEYTEKVGPIDTRSELEKKTKVSVGDIFSANGLYDIEVVECAETEYLRATNYDESKQYESYNNKFIDLILKVKNNTKTDLTGIYGYVVIDGEGIVTKERVETSGNTDLEYLDITPIKGGEEGLVHIFAAVDENIDVEDLKMRFNLAGNCYYCDVQ